MSPDGINPINYNTYVPQGSENLTTGNSGSSGDIPADYEDLKAQRDSLQAEYDKWNGYLNGRAKNDVYMGHPFQVDYDNMFDPNHEQYNKLATDSWETVQQNVQGHLDNLQGQIDQLQGRLDELEGRKSLGERVMDKMMEQVKDYDKQIDDLIKTIKNRSKEIEKWQGYLGQARAKDNGGGIRGDYDGKWGGGSFASDDWSKIEERIRGYIDRLNNDQQMDTVKLNTLGTSRDRCWDAANSAKDKEGQALKGLTDALKT